MDRLLVSQISDLHMGHLLETAVFDKNASQRGHDPLLCRLLHTQTRFVAALHGVKPDDMRWIISGDLTRTGDAAEFGVGRDFMETPPQLDALGRAVRPTLGIPRDHYEDLPGNHDHFNGWDEQSLVHQALNNPPPAWNAGLFPSIFKPTAWDNLANPWMSALGSIRLELFGVDSNSGLAGTTANRLAHGKISDAEFTLLEESLLASNEMAETQNIKRVRAIVCHHAFTKRPQAGAFKASPLVPAHVHRLTELAARYRVAAILTGHTHAESFRQLRVSTQPFGESYQRLCTVYEIRCPTTLQGLADALVHGFWIHHLFRDRPDAHVVWRPSLYKLAAGRLRASTFSDLILP